MNEEKFKNYFLGKLSEAETSAFEEEIALDAELTEEAQIAEGELIDDYLRNSLSLADEELFEAVYLVTEARRERLSLAQSLWNIANEKKASEIAATKNALSFWQIGKVWRVAFAGVGTILLLGTIVFFWLNSRDKEEIVQNQNANQSSAPKTENQDTQPIENVNLVNQTEHVNSINQAINNSNLPQNKNASPTPKITSTPTPKENPAPVFASFTLLPGTLRDEGEQAIKIAPRMQKITLRLSLPKDAEKYQSYTAIFRTAEGGTVFTAPNLKSLNITLPAQKLENRTYIIFLEGQNAQNVSESVAEYTFRVRR